MFVFRTTSPFSSSTAARVAAQSQRRRRRRPAPPQRRRRRRPAPPQRRRRRRPGVLRLRRGLRLLGCGPTYTPRLVLTALRVLTFAQPKTSAYALLPCEPPRRASPQTVLTILRPSGLLHPSTSACACLVCEPPRRGLQPNLVHIARFCVVYWSPPTRSTLHVLWYFLAGFKFSLDGCLSICDSRRARRMRRARYEV